MKLTKSQVDEFLDYNRETGVFKWIKSPGRKFAAGTVAGTLKPDGYVLISLRGVKISAHRLAWFIVYGVYPTEQIDHINKNRSDNSIKNLREVSNQENHRNKTLLKNNKSGIMGVGWCNTRNKWRCSITVDLKHVFIGNYDSFFDACCARKSKERELGFHVNHGSKIGNKYSK